MQNYGQGDFFLLCSFYYVFFMREYNILLSLFFLYIYVLRYLDILSKVVEKLINILLFFWTMFSIAYRLDYSSILFHINES